jgi:membrane fusion protein, multidrug efflux system
VKSIFFILLFVTTAAVSGCSSNTEGKEEPSTQSSENVNETLKSAVLVEVISIEKGFISTSIAASATLEAERKISVFPLTINHVRQINVEEGDLVKKGEVLMLLKDDVQLSQYKQEKVQVHKAQLELDRLNSLYKKSLVSAKEFQDAQLNLEALELSLQDAKRELGYTIVRAPIDGTVVERLVQIGDYVGARRDESAKLFEIVDFNSIVARVHIPAKHLTDIALNQTVWVKAPSLNDALIEAYVMRISPIVDAQTGTVKVTVGFNDLGQLRPGMFVNLSVVTDVKENAILVPKEALVYDAEQIYVYRLLSGSEPAGHSVERVLITPELADNINIEPVSGIRLGDRLVVAGKLGLRDQSLVRLPEEPTAEH